MIEEQIKNILNSSLQADNVFYRIARQGTSPPYICYFLVSSVFDDVMYGQSGYEQRCYQIDIFSKNFIEISKLKENIISKLKGVMAYDITCDSDYESETQLYREQIEFYI